MMFPDKLLGTSYPRPTNALIVVPGRDTLLR